jgi:hypothetical protein
MSPTSVWKESSLPGSRPKPSRKHARKKETPIELGRFYVSEKEDLGGAAVPYSPTKVYEVCGAKPGRHWRVLYRDKLGDMWNCTLGSFARAVREVPEPSDWGEFKTCAVSLMNDAEDLLAARDEGYIILGSEGGSFDYPEIRFANDRSKPRTSRRK